MKTAQKSISSCCSIYYFWIVAVFFPNLVFSQAVFKSNVPAGTSNKNWNNPANWTLESGTSTLNYPVAGDQVTILGGDSIRVDSIHRCQELTIQGGATLVMDSVLSVLTVSSSLDILESSFVDLSIGLLTIIGSVNVTDASLVYIDLGAFSVSGTMNVSKSSTIRVDFGALSVLGLFFLNAPTLSAGTTLLDVRGGLFNCAGGMTVTGVNSSRLAELRIGNSAVTVFGGLATVTQNAKINFSGTGALTLAGPISIANTNSFVAGAGSVVYLDLGIPGTNQVIAPLNYNRLIISGLTGGYKEINGVVTISDTLTLLSDTLVINAGGSLILEDGASIIRTEGKLLSTPTFAGVTDVIYNNVLRDTTGLELPTNPNVLRNLTIHSISGLVLNTDVTVNGILNLERGALISNGHVLHLTEAQGGLGSDPAIQRTNGYVVGTITRNIGTNTGLRVFPLGVDESSDYRALSVDFTTAPTQSGILTVNHFNTAAHDQIGFPLPEGGTDYTAAAPMYWQVDAAGGLTGGAYSLSLLGEGIEDVLDIGGLTIVKRPSTGGNWVLDGTPGMNSGEADAPLVVRENMAGFSQFAIASDDSNPLPIGLLGFQAEIKDEKVLLTWSTAYELNNLGFEIERADEITMNFTPIAFIDGKGDSNQMQNYQYFDSPDDGKWYYRLKQVDLDENYTFSPITVIYFRNVTAQDFLISPNPTSDMALIEYELSNDTFINLSLYDPKGHLVKELVNQKQTLGKYQFLLNGQNLSAGLYYCKLQRGSDIAYKKLLLTK